MFNPFFYGNPVSPEHFIGRKEIIADIISRLQTSQSTHIVGEPRIGKSSLLKYLEAELSAEILSSFVDIDSLDQTCDATIFWECAFRPIGQLVKHMPHKTSLATAYQSCLNSHFDYYHVEELCLALKESNYRIVLLIDELDRLLVHPILCTNSFLGQLRTCTIHSKGVLTLIIASRQTQGQIYAQVKDLIGGGSPYFNFAPELTVGPFSLRECSELLDRGAAHFTAKDRQQLVALAGGHPFLLQAAAGELWNTYQQKILDPYHRWQRVNTRLYELAATTLTNTWDLWDDRMRAAFTIAALPQLAIPGLKFDERGMAHDDFNPELQILEKHGFVDATSATKSGYQISTAVFVWWFANEIIRNVRDESSYTLWLRKHKIEQLLSGKQREKLGKFFTELSGLAKEGAKAFIEAAAKGSS